MLSSDAMEGRRIGTRGGALARAFVEERLTASGIVPFGATLDEPFTYGPVAGTGTVVHGVNVVGHLDGTLTPQRYLVVSAHYDHLGIQNGQIYRGADDNASGTAALFAIASYFRAHRPRHALIFTAFDGEEEGLRGSRAFVHAPPVEAAAIRLDLNMDMIGREGSDRLFVVGLFHQPGLRPVIDRLARQAPVKLLIGHDTPGDREDWTEESDQYAFLEAHIPALYFGVEDFDQHHQPSDRFETMSLDFYVRAVETMILATEDFDAHLDELK